MRLALVDVRLGLMARRNRGSPPMKGKAHWSRRESGELRKEELYGI